MKAFAATGHATPLTAALTLVDVSEPVPAVDEAVIAVEAYSVNRGEALSLNGTFGTGSAVGTRLGQDVAGRVVRAASDGTGPGPGARVVAWASAGWAERVAVSTSKIAELPDAVGTAEAAALPLAGLTALRLVREAGDVRGKRALLTGASGGVGHYLVELLVAAGAQVTAVTSSAVRGKRLAEFGAQVVRTAAESEGRFELVFESVGGQEFADAVSRLANGGTVLWYGQAGLAPITLDFFQLVAATPLTLKHFPHWVSEIPDHEDLATLVRLVAEGRLHPEIGRTAHWEQTPAVIEDLYQRRIRGNAVLTL